MGYEADGELAVTGETANPTCAKNAQVQSTPAEMPGVEEIAELLVSAHASLATPQNTARAVLALFAPILAEKERRISEWQAEVRREGERFKEEVNDLNAECDRLHARALAAEAALAAERERCALIAERFSDAALKCDRCGDVRNTYAPGECSGELAYRETAEYQTSVAIHGAYAANRYFEKHLCRPREMDIAETIAAIAAALRAEGE